MRAWVEARFAGPGARWTLAAFTALLLATAGAWMFVRITVKQGYPAYVADADQHDGDELVLSIFRVDEVVDGEGYIVEKGFLYVPIRGPTDGLVVGQEISVGGAFQADDLVVVEDWREIHHWRKAKKALGVAGLAVIGLGWPAVFRLRRWGLEARDPARPGS